MLKNSYPTNPLFIKYSHVKKKKAASLTQEYPRLRVFITFSMGTTVNNLKTYTIENSDTNTWKQHILRGYRLFPCTSECCIFEEQATKWIGQKYFWCKKQWLWSWLSLCWATFHEFLNVLETKISFSKVTFYFLSRTHIFLFLPKMLFRWNVVSKSLSVNFGKW